MEIRFASAKLKKEFESQALLQKRYGEQANKIQLRLALLKASPNLASDLKENLIAAMSSRENVKAHSPSI